MDHYTLCLLGWYFGIFPSEVEGHKWTQQDINNAQRLVEERHVDPEEYWWNEAEKSIYWD